MSDKKYVVFYNKGTGKRMVRIPNDKDATQSEINAIKGLLAYENNMKKEHIRVVRE